MRKFITLSLMAAGLMAFSASAAMPDYQIGEDNIQLEHKFNHQTGKFFTNHHKSPKKVVESDGALADGYYVLGGSHIALTEDNLQYSEYVGFECIIEHLTETEYSIDILMDMDNPSTPLKATWDATNKTLTVAADQVFWTNVGTKYGDIPYSFYTVGLKAGTNYLEIKERNELVFTVDGNQLKYTPSEADGLIDYLYLGGEVEYQGQKGKIGYGYIMESYMTEYNCYGTTTVTTAVGETSSTQYTNYFCSNLTQNADHPYLFNIANLFGMGNPNNVVTFCANKDDKSFNVINDTQVVLSFNSQNVDYVFDLLDITSDDALVKGTYEVKAIEGSGNKYTLVTLSGTLAPWERSLNFPYELFEEVKIQIPFNLEDAFSAIEGVESDLNNANAPVQYFDLQGRKVNGENLSNGIYVRRQGTDVQKVFVK